MIEGFGRIGATYDDMATVLGVSTRTIERRMADDGEFRRAYKTGEADVNSGLRRKQIEMALKGDRTMLIWLGKQRLGQKDKHELAGDPEHPIAVEGLSTTELLAALPEAIARLGAGTEVAAALAIALRRGEG